MSVRHFDVKSTNLHIILDQHEMEVEKLTNIVVVIFHLFELPTMDISLSCLEMSIWRSDKDSYLL